MMDQNHTYIACKSTAWIYLIKLFKEVIISE